MTLEDIFNIKVDPEDTDCHDTVTALGQTLIGCCFDIHQSPGEMDENAAIRAAVRSLADALSDDYLNTRTEAINALRQALDEIESIPDSTGSAPRGCLG